MRRRTPGSEGEPVEVAIVGIGCRFPGGVTGPEGFWDLLANGVDAIADAPAERFELDGVRAGGFVDGIDGFDADFFGISPREARRIDPQQRLLLEVAWEALEDGGLPADRLAGTGAGVFVGIASNDYGAIQLQPQNIGELDGYAMAGGALSIAANRISYCLDLRGPSVAVDTACSSSLTAAHLAVESLARGECDVAIVGGVNALVSPAPTIGFRRASMLSPDGRCRPFGRDANGYVRSEGAGAVVLRRLRDARANGDRVYAVIRATAVNQDGRTAGISVPNPDAQKALFAAALRRAGTAPAAVQYVEAHGTGTPVGDPREAEAIGAVYSRGRPGDRPCLVGSVKGNIGHLEAAAGIAGLVKTALALAHRTVPPSLHFDGGNPEIPFERLRLRVPERPEPWPAAPGGRLAAVNSFGFGGANAHALLAEAPADAAPVRAADDGDARVLTVSARSPQALRELALAYADALDEPRGPSFRDACFTAACRRTHHAHRLAVVARSAPDARARLRAQLAGEDVRGVARGERPSTGAGKLAFVFSGMGPQHPGMGRGLLRDEPVFRRAIEECDRLLTPLAGWSLLELLSQDGPAAGELETDRAQAGNFAVQVALAALLRSWGVVPDAVVGHSSGEMSAVAVAGGLSLADAVRVAHHRGRLQHSTSGTGGMLAARIDAAAAARLVDGREDRVALAAVNAPESVTLSGEVAAIEELAATLEGQGVSVRRLAVNVPYHAPQMDRLREELVAALAAVRSVPPATRVVSTVTGTWAEGPYDAAHWWRNVRRPVRFAQSIEQLIADGFELFLELGPHPVLAAPMLETLAARGARGAVLPTLRRDEDERETLLRSLAALYARGRAIDWAGVCGGDGRCVRLPTYPWQRERHWFEPSRRGTLESPSAAGEAASRMLGPRLRAAQPTWELDLGAAHLAFLDGHVVDGRATFPAAGYVAAALAAAHALDGDAANATALADVRFHRLFGLERRADLLVQCAATDDGSIAIHSATKDGPLEWSLRADARQTTATPEPPPLDLDSVRARCGEEIFADDVYRSLEARRGLRYEGAFRSVRALRRGPNEALALIAAPDGVEVAAEDYPVHPALLDGALQALGAAAAGGGTVVPFSVERIELRAPPGGRFWAHATTAPPGRDGAAVEGSVRLLDDSGRVLMTCENVRMRRLGARRDPSGDRIDDDRIDDDRIDDDGNYDDWIYEERWEHEPLADASPPTAGELADEVAASLAAFAEGIGFDDYYRTAEPALNLLAARLAADALTELGFDRRRDGPVEAAVLAERLGVVPRHRRLFARLLQLARSADAHASSVEPPAGRAYASAVTLVRESGGRLAATLRGEEDARAWLFSGEPLRALEHLYEHSPFLRVYTNTVAEAVAAAATRRDGRPLRILEVGGGTGGATVPVLSRLGDRDFEYVFTDVSAFFVRAARERFAATKQLRAELLDVERPPPAATAYDVMVAADVVHATADVRATLRNLHACLAPGGLLVLLEPIRRSAWLDLVFGQLDGWWRFEDRDLRSESPLLATNDWTRTLADAGFAETAAVADTYDAPGDDPAQAVVLSTAAGVARPARRWLVLTDRRGVGPAAAAALREGGDGCTFAWPADAYEPYGVDAVGLSPARVDHWERLLREQDRFDGVLHLWSLDAPDDASTPDLMAFQERACGSVVALLQALQAARLQAPELWLVTAGARPVADGSGGERVRSAQAPLWGLGRVLRSEAGSASCRLVDVSPAADADDVAALVAELTASGGAQAEVAYRGGRRFVRRLVHAGAEPTRPLATTQLSPDEASFRLEARVPGRLETLGLRETSTPLPGAGEVVVRVAAAGLIFKDVLIALGMPFVAGADGPPPLGWECAGIVEACGADVTAVRPGDEVVAVASGAFGARIVARAEHVVAKPPALTFERAATTPAAFVTAVYALERLAHLRSGERVLVHSAAGGVGLAAVQVARRAGAEVVATAGTPEKRAYLESLGIDHVFDSRSLAFADEVLERTGGEGVDVVLNSLPGEALRKSLATLRPYGRFVELGKRDIHENSTLGLLPFERNLSFFAFDLHALFHDRPAVVGSCLRAVVRRLGRGELEPLPLRSFDLAAAEDAFRLLAQGRHIGKVVLTVGGARYAAAPRGGDRFRLRGGTYLVTGGLGGFALAFARWLADAGAGTLVLMSRSGVPRAEDEAALGALRASSADVVVVRGDVADPVDVERVLAQIRSGLPPLRGVVHAAMVMDDDLLGKLDYERVRAVLAPKVAGAWNLHRLTRADELDLFVLFSSVSALVGHPTQGAYAAANEFLGALAAERRAAGRPALAVDWGPIAAVGYVARHRELERRLERLGWKSMTAAEACGAFARVLERGDTRVALSRHPLDGREGGETAAAEPDEAAPPAQGTAEPPARNGFRSRVAEASPGERASLLEGYLVRSAARVLDASPQRIDVDRPLPEMGLDSLMAVELRTAVRLDLGVEVPVVDLLEGLTLRKLEETLLAAIDGDGR